MGYLLDTNIIAAYLKNDRTVRGKIEQLMFRGETVLISVISYYETKRRLLYAKATKKMSDFNTFCEAVKVAFLNELKVVEKAAEINANLRGKGTPLEDADILIAATAMSHDLTLVSHDSDMLRVSGLTVEDWMTKV